MPGFLIVQPLWEWMRVRFVKLWVAVAESGALSGSTNTVAWMFVPLYFAITWFSPPSASAAAASWRSSEPWSSRWKWQSSRPWPAPPSQTPTTASSHPLVHFLQHGAACSFVLPGTAWRASGEMALVWAPTWHGIPTKQQKTKRTKRERERRRWNI